MLGPDGRPPASDRRRRRRPRSAPPRPRWTVPPVLVRQVRNGVVESVHRGDIVEVDATGRMLRVIGDPDRVVYLRSTVKPFGLLALLRAGGRREFDLTTEELAVMASSHSGEDVHVRTIQALYRRIGIAAGGPRVRHEGMPLDALTAARLARDGERPSPLRHMCSGQHSVFVLLAKLGGWELETYWQPEHPAHVAYREAVAAVFDVAPDAAADRHRRLRRPHLRVPAARGRAGVRDAGGSRRRSRPTTGGRPSRRTWCRSATRCCAHPELVGGHPRPARHLADEGGRRAAS